MILRKIIPMIFLSVLSATIYPMYRSSGPKAAMVKANQEAKKANKSHQIKQGYAGEELPVMNLKVLRQFSFTSGNEKLAYKVAQSPFFRTVMPYDVATMPKESLKTANYLNQYFENSSKKTIHTERDGYNDIVELPSVIKGVYRDEQRNPLKAAVKPDLSTQVVRIIVPTTAGAVVGGLGGAVYGGIQSATKSELPVDTRALEIEKRYAYVDSYCEAYPAAYDAAFGPLSEQIREEKAREAVLTLWTASDEELAVIATRRDPLYGLDNTSLHPKDFCDSIERYSDQLAAPEAHIKASEIANAAGVLAAAQVVALPANPANSSYDEIKFRAGFGAFAGACIGFGEGCRHVKDPMVITDIPCMNEKI